MRIVWATWKAFIINELMRRLGKRRNLETKKSATDKVIAMPRYISAPAFFLGLSLLFLNTHRADAGLTHHHYRTCSKCCIPNHHYGHDTPRFGATEIAVANAATGNAGARLKTFHFRATALTVEHIQLDQVGLALRETGTDPPDATLLATGRITHSGGADGGLIGNNVTIRIRAYVASSREPNAIPPDAVMVWQATSKQWISRGRPQVISLVPANLPQPEKLKTYMEQITHIEVQLEYSQDR